jgi:hypothetical protein
MNIHRLTLAAVTLSALTLFASRSAQAQSGTVYVGNSLSATGGSDGVPPLVILGEYNPAGPPATASAATTLPTGTVLDVKFYGNNYNFTLYALSYVGAGPNANEQTFKVVASEDFSGMASSGIQTLAVSDFQVNAGDLLAFAGIGPYYPQVPNDGANSDATYENSSDPGSFIATPPGGAGMEFTVGLYTDPSASYEYVSDVHGNQGRTYAIGVDVSVASGAPSTTIDAVNRYAYGANVGWMDWYADGADGAVIGAYVCSGYIYSANVGWINLGNGSPANGIQYQNNSAGDFGVNQDGLGNLRGYAYGANIGWINFESTGAPMINMITGQFSGYAWSANCGWISLNNAAAYVQTDTVNEGSLAPNGLPTAWLLANFGTVNVNANADPTGKGMTILQDYLAGTNPNDAHSVFSITGGGFSSSGDNASLTWNSVPTRSYYVQETPGLSSPVWTDSGLGLISPSAGSTTTANFTETVASPRFYRVEAVRPLILTCIQ